MSGEDTESLELPSRRTIYQRIEAKPGIHFRALDDTLDLAKGTLQYHLRWLVDAGLVEESDDGEYNRYYPEGDFEPEDRRVLNALRRKIARRILAYLASEGAMTTSELADRLSKSNSTVSWHLSKLQEAGLVERDRDGRQVYYSLTDSDRVRYLYTVYRGSFTDRLVDKLFDLWDAY
ncbi:MAG: putative transcriptional regulator [Haloarculaceae archaeon]|jgi:predicted transcriptional regulator